MAVIVEDGTGVSGANAWDTAAFVTSYLADRNRASENGWNTVAGNVRDAAVIAATDYIEQRWALRFKGRKEFIDISRGRATLTLTAIPLNSTTVIIGATTYTFNTSLGGANSVLIAASVAENIDNLIAAILADATKVGTAFGTGTVANVEATAEAGPGDTMLVVAKEAGTPGNGHTTTTTVAGASWSSATTTGGGDFAEPQPLSFPRINLIDSDGVTVRGIPIKLKFAMAEYAVRSLNSTLLPDPTIDPSGQSLKRKLERVGPLTTEVEYQEGGGVTQLLRPYPGADRYLADYISTPGRVIRG